MDDFRHKHRLLLYCPCFYALQETDNWTISAMDVPGHIVYVAIWVKLSFVSSSVLPFPPIVGQPRDIAGHGGGCNDDFVRLSAAQWIR